jgi:hypothetical protein
VRGDSWPGHLPSVLEPSVVFQVNVIGLMQVGVADAGIKHSIRISFGRRSRRSKGKGDNGGYDDCAA